MTREAGSQKSLGDPIRLLMTATIVGIALRIIAVFLASDSLAADPDAYRKLAENWSRSGTYGQIDDEGNATPTAYRPPLYPWLLSLLVDREGTLQTRPVAMLHAILAASTLLLVALIAWQLQPKLAWLAPLIVALDPILVRQSQLVMTETLATFLSLLVWFVWLKMYRPTIDHERSRRVRLSSFYCLFFGGAIGLAILARPTAAAWFVLIMLGWLLGSGQSFRERLRGTLLTSVAVLVVISPWVIRNQRVFGVPIWSTTHGGYTLLLANNPVLYKHLADGDASRDWDEDRFHRLWESRSLSDAANGKPEEDPRQAAYWSRETPMPVQDQSEKRDELAVDRLANQAAWGAIRRMPDVFVWSCVVRASWLWTPLPNPRPNSNSKWLIAVGYTLLYFVALLGIWQMRSELFSWQIFSSPWLVPCMLLISLTMVHAVYWSNMRMRAPAMPVLAILATIGIERLMTVRATSLPIPK